MAGPLDGTRVLDITRGMPGAVASMVLADYGADVIGVRHPDPAGDWSPAATATWDRGKRLLFADLATPAGATRVGELAASADIVLVGLSPRSVERFGLGPDEVTATNPDVVYVAITGFGLGDRRPTPGFDALAAAELGAMVTAPGHRDGPVFLGHPAVSYSTAFVALIGALAALRARVVWGRGDVVDVSLQDGVLAQLTMNWWSEKRVSFMRSRTRAGGLDMGHTRMLLRRFRCADGRLIQVHTGAAGAFGRLMAVLGLAGEVSPASGPVESACPLTDDDLAVLERTPELFAGRPAAEWLEELWANEIAALPVQQPGEAFDDPQVRHNGLMRTLDHPELGRVEVVGPPIRLALTPARDPLIASEALPTGEGWSAPGLPGAAADANAPSRPPLDGVRVVEFASFFAAPYANRFLCDLGADVVKVEPTSGDPIRSLPDPFEGASRGKRSIAVDVKHPDAAALIRRLVAEADVVQHNLRPGAAERLGIDDASVRAVNPDVIYDYAPGYGSTGPKSRLQSFTPLQGGFVGIHAEAAGDGNEPMPTFGNEDYYNGLLNAIASLLALVRKARTGEGQYVECPQLSSSVFVTSHWYRRSGVPRSTLPGLDAGQTGWSPHVRLYQCLEGWVCVCCVDAAQRAALEAVVLGEPSSGTAGDVAARLQDEFFGATASDWVAGLRTADVPCTAVRERHFVHDFLRDPTSIASGRATAFTHQRVGDVRAIARIVQLRSLPPRPDTRAPLLGEHTAEIARSAGLDAADIDRLAAVGVLRLAEG